MSFAAWWSIQDARGASTKLEIELEPLELRTVRRWQTAHSASTGRTNALLRVRLDGVHEGASEVGLPPYKPGVYEGTLEDCERLAEAFAYRVTGRLGKRVTSWCASSVRCSTPEEDDDDGDALAPADAEGVSALVLPPLPTSCLASDASDNEGNGESEDGTHARVLRVRFFDLLGELLEALDGKWTRAT